MSRTIIARGAALAAATMLALTACGGTDDAPAEEREAGAAEAADDAPQDGAADEDADTDEEDTGSDEDGADRSTEDSSDDDASDEAASGEDGAQDDEDATDEEDGAGDEDGDAAADEGTVVEIGTEFTDEETGDVITIVSAVRDNPSEYYMASDNPDGEMIYLEVEVEAGDAYGGVISERNFVLDDGGTEVNYAASADDELVDAGYEYFDGAPRREGGGTGYIPIYLETTGDTLAGAYVRPELEVLGEDTTVPEFRGEFEVPAA